MWPVCEQWPSLILTSSSCNWPGYVLGLYSFSKRCCITTSTHHPAVSQSWCSAWSVWSWESMDHSGSPTWAASPPHLGSAILHLATLCVDMSPTCSSDSCSRPLHVGMPSHPAHPQRWLHMETVHVTGCPTRSCSIYISLSVFTLILGTNSVSDHYKISEL